MRLICQIMFLFFSLILFGQDLPKNAVPGKCYLRCFSYGSKVEWEETDCDSLKWNTQNGNFKIKGEKAANIIKSRTKFKKYQEKLIKLGYNLEVTGRMDNKTIDAHHLYLKDKKKAAKKEAKRIKKANRDSLKQTKLQNKRSQKAL